MLCITSDMCIHGDLNDVYYLEYVYPWRFQRCVFPVICVSMEISTLYIPCDMCIHGDLNDVYYLGYCICIHGELNAVYMCISLEISLLCNVYSL